MFWTKKVAEFLNIDAVAAEKVVDFMYIGGFDFSESSYETIEAEANRVWSYLKDGG